MTTENIYTLPYRCTNCGHEWEAKLPKGVLAANLECPECDCVEGRRTIQHVYKPPKYEY